MHDPSWPRLHRPALTPISIVDGSRSIVLDRLARYSAPVPSPTSAKRALGVVLLGVIFSVLGLSSFTPHAVAQDDEHVLSGTLRVGREIVADVDLTVTDETGAEIGTAVTDAEGKWSVPITAPGVYSVEIDVATLPDGVGFKEGATNIVERDIAALDKPRFPVGFKLEDGAAVPIIAPESGFDRFINRSVSGLRVGLLVALASVGLSLIYGVTGLVNFGHSEMVTFGAVLGFAFEALFGLNSMGSIFGLSISLVLAVAFGIAAGGLLGFILERGMFRPLRDRKLSNISLMIVSIGLAFVMRYLIVIFFRTEPVGYKHYLLQEAIDIGPISIPKKDLWIMISALVLLVLVGLLLQRTRLGTAMRAVADNPPLAQSSGIDINRTILAVWIAGSALAAAGGIFLGLTNIIEWQMGEKMLLLMFAAVTLGGLGTAYGAMVGGLVIGFASEVITLLPFVDNDLKFLVALVVMIFILLVRPQGILGVRERFG